MWRSSWWLRSCGTTTRRSSSSPSRLLRPAQTVHLKSTKVLDRNPRTCHFSVDVRRRPCEGDGPIGRVLRSCRDSTDRHVLKATKRSVGTLLPDLTALSRSSHNPVAFWPRPVVTLIGVFRDLTPGLTALSLSLYVPVAILGFCIKPHLLSCKPNRYTRALVGRSRTSASRSGVPSGSARHYLTGSSGRRRNEEEARRREGADEGSTTGPRDMAPPPSRPPEGTGESD
ncbi:hypothetical protein Taro_030004 [Colocasia esculenta]|uniref:Uncharacterized protein n=1 Tax=Colocasia esculenta TaxID=4460 RepID=A0A843W1Z8_COLES|nr:hypothetical protein [Colocasia esculenta]